jgi:hypothetical protein
MREPSVMASKAALLEARREARLRVRERDLALRELHEHALDLLGDREMKEKIVTRARRVVALWEQARTCSPRYIEEWRLILSDPANGLRARVLDPSAPRGLALMHNTPFGFLLRGKPAS